MSAPVIRDEVHAAWRSILIRAGAREDTVDALILELDQACEGHGARLPRYPRPEDSNAVALAPLPEPGDATAGAAAARAALQAARARRPAPDDRTEPLPPLPEGSE